MARPSSSPTKSSVPERQSVTVSINIDENKESTVLIWFDPKIGSREDTERTKQRLRHINNYVVFYTELESCITYIQSIQNEKIFLITSGSRASDLLPRVASLCQVDSIFIFCMKTSKYEYLSNEYSKIVGMYSEIDELCSSIQEQVDLVDKQLQAFSFFDQHQKSIKDLTKESAEFLWFQIFKDVILRLPRNQQAKQQMIDICRQYYRGNSKQQKLIDEFERNYRAEEAIRWYSKQSFVYKMINKALRSEDIDQLHTFRFFIGDLCENLAREHQQMILSTQETLTVYRGVKLSNDELDQLKKNEGQLISTNGFLSTSRNRSLAFTFATKPTKRTDVFAVIFEIKCNVQQLCDSTVFADIVKFSEFPDEQEVLFDLSVPFELESVRYEGEIWLIKMNLTNDGRAIIQEYIKETHREEEYFSTAIMFGRLTCTLGQYDKSQKYFEHMLNDSKGEDLAWIEFNIGRALHYKGEWKTARKYYDLAYDRMMNAKPTRIKDSARVLNNIGNILKDEAKNDQALEFHQRALKIRENFYPSSHVDIAYSLNSIGLILYAQGKYHEALESHQRALKIRENFYPSGHVDIATSLNNIGRILCDHRKYDEALKFHQQALEIHEKCYPSGHVYIATSLNNIGLVLYAQENYDEALEFHQRALETQEQCYPSNHVYIAHTLANIGVILHTQEKYDKALEFYQRAHTIYENSLPIERPSRARTEQNIQVLQKLIDNLFEKNIS